MPALSVMLDGRAGRTAVLAARFALAAVLALAALPKLVDPQSFAQSIANYHIVPDWAAGMLAVFVPAVEAVVAVALASGVAARGAALVATALLITFTAAMLQAMARGIDIDCGCFGASSRVEIGWSSLVRNAALVACAILVLVARSSSRPLPGHPQPPAESGPST